MPFEFDYVIVGGGLQGALLVLALVAKQPSATIALVEEASRLGGNHTWCFHAGDLTDGAASWVEPLVVYRWPGYHVVFPAWDRHIERPYFAITSERLHEVVARRFATLSGSAQFLGQRAKELARREVLLESGRLLHGRIVVDARGPQVENGSRRQGYQKFLGLEVELESAHGLQRPLLMDTRVDQIDGFRFVYTLPLTERRLLIEDTYFSNTPDLERSVLRRRALEYATRRGYAVQRVAREEEGVLPMPWRGVRRRDEGPLVAGYRGGYFHPGTGYSFPVAVRLAELLAGSPSGDAIETALKVFDAAVRRQGAFCHALNYMLFCWFPPEQRWHIFQRFYRLPLRTIERFFALRLQPIDMARLVLGRPPRGMSVRYGFAKEKRK